MSAKQFQRLLDRLSRKKWVVYAKPPFGGPEYVLHYLARYTHRVAISNHRLASFDVRDRRIPAQLPDVPGSEHAIQHWLRVWI